MTKHMHEVRDLNGLSAQRMKEVAPSIFATRAAPSRSDRYAYISTAKLLRPLFDAGWIATRVAQRMVRAKGGRNPLYTRHAVTMRPADFKAPKGVGDVVPEVTFINSHDGQSVLRGYSGFIRLVCLNGLTVSSGGPEATFSQRHIGKVDGIVEKAQAAIQVSLDAVPTVRAMMKHEMKPQRIATFASEVQRLVYEREDFDPQLLLTARREEDDKPNVWTVFNRVQENVMRGGVHLPARDERRASTLRGLTHLQRSIDVNQQLWGLAVAELKA